MDGCTCQSRSGCVGQQGSGYIPSRYLPRRTGPDGADPPSDWESIVGLPAWTRVPDGQWYLHLFTPEQPDLNWANHEVRDDFQKTLRFWSDRGVDGFRVDVAHGLAKNLVEPLAAKARLTDSSLPPGANPFWDRDEVHDIYAEWRQVFNEYEPPRAAVAEAWVRRSRRLRYASPRDSGMPSTSTCSKRTGTACSFRSIITENPAEAQQQGSSTTWVLSNHDVVRHATRYGLPVGDHGGNQPAKGWLLSNGTTPELDRDLRLRRARAATLLLLALPGSAYLYQGEELGLHEVGDIPAASLPDPVFGRSGGTDKGRDGCRVPLPWTADGPSFGFRTGAAHWPQPDWFGSFSVATQDADPKSTLAFYRPALSWRRKLRMADGLEWKPAAGGQVLHFSRSGGWQSMTNLGSEPVALPDGTVVIASTPLDGDQLPADATAWVLGPPLAGRTG